MYLFEYNFSTLLYVSVKTNHYIRCTNNATVVIFHKLWLRLTFIFKIRGLGKKLHLSAAIHKQSSINTIQINLLRLYNNVHLGFIPHVKQLYIL